jgi:hypothetical protein
MISSFVIGSILLGLLSIYDDKIALELNPTRWRVQNLLAVKLPESVNEVRYYKDQPNSEINHYTVYIRFRISEDEYMALMQQMNMTFYAGATTPYSYLFPGHWKASRITVDWWNLTLETPRNNTVTRQYGSAGWIIAKYENGYAYIKVFAPNGLE